MRHVNQTRDGIIQALTPAPLKPSFRVRYFNADDDSTFGFTTVFASDRKQALAKAYEIGNDEFGHGNFDCNLVFGS